MQSLLWAEQSLCQVLGASVPVQPQGSGDEERRQGTALRERWSMVVGSPFSGTIKQVWLSLSAFVQPWPTRCAEGHLCLTSLWSRSSWSSMGCGRQSINGGAGLSPGPPRSPAACSHWMASLVAHSNAIMSEKRAEWRSQCTPLLRRSDCSLQQSLPCGDVKQSYQ